MLLSDRDIKKAIKDKKITIKPTPDYEIQLGSCSLDLRLGNEFRIFEHSRHPIIDPRNKVIPPNITRLVKISEKAPFIMQPGDFVLAMTYERVTLTDQLLGRLEGRSSLGRLGIVVHSTASVFDPGWDGNCVLELGNLGRIPVALYPKMRICAMTFEQLSSPAENPYNTKNGAKYTTQSSPVESKIHSE